MDEGLINKVNSYIDSLDRERRKEVKRKVKEAENKRFKLGFVIGATYFVDANNKPIGSIVNFITTDKHFLCYFISTHRYDGQEKMSQRSRVYFEKSNTLSKFADINH